MAKAKVAALKVQPDTVLKDIEKLCDLAGMSRVLDRKATTILKDNISWHFPFPGANTTPWQLEGTIRALRACGYSDISCVQNKTVVTNAFKGEDLNNYVPIFRKHDIPVLYNFREGDMKWVEYRPKARLHVLQDIFPEGVTIPDYFFGKNIVHLPTIKCVAGDTRLLLADGSSITARELFAREASRSPAALIDADGASHVTGSAMIMAMTPDGSVKPCRAVVFSRSYARGRRLLRLRTRSGRTLTATAEHPMRTPSGWALLKDVLPGDRLAIARRIPVSGVSQALPQTHAEKPPTRAVARVGRRLSREFAEGVLRAYAEGSTVTAIADERGVRWQTIRHVLKRHQVALRRNVTPIRIPERTSPAFWRWMGYFLAEGSVESVAGCDKLWWTNQTPEIHAEYLKLTHELFGVDPRESRHNVYVYSRNLGAFLEEIGLSVPMNAGNKRVPPMLFRCPDDEVAAFLSGYLDGDGHVSARQAEVSAVSKSEALARDVESLFARLGVVAFVKPIEQEIPGRWGVPRTYHQVVVSGSAIGILAQQLTLRHPVKSQRLAAQAARLSGSRQPSNWDTVPWPKEVVGAIRNGLGVTQAATGLASSVSNVENGYTHPTPRIARQLLSVFREADADAEFSNEIADLAMLASEDLAWDKVAEVTSADSEEVDLYDVTVPGADCFLANGIVVHNCHIYTTTTGAMKNAFGGLLNTKRHYTHTWIHRTLVDLLAIQKEIHSGIFAVMDGTTCGNGPGPRTMYPVIKDYMLASEDQVAIDAVAAKMMGFDPMSLEYIKVAHDDGLGVGDPRDIEVVGADVSKESWGFSVGDNAASRVGDVMWFGPLKRFQKLFFHTPLVNVFIMGSEAYHDYYRWPRKDRDTFEAWKRETAWGKLFVEYSRSAPQPAPTEDRPSAG